MHAYFSINPDTLKSIDLPFNVYINSSASSHQKFVCLFKPGTALSPQMVDDAKKRFHQLYLKEEDRSSYLNFLSRSLLVSKNEKTNFFKQSAVVYLEQIVGVDWQTAKPEYLASCVIQCRDLVSNLIDVIDQDSLDQIKFLLKDLAEHDFYTFDHSVNVCIYSIKFYKTIFPNRDKESQIDMGLGALLHDIGKSKVTTAIINKPSSLSVDEFKVIQQHPQLGREIFLSILHLLPRATVWNNIIDVIFQHHENIDGSGYPSGLHSQDINVNAKICAIADMFDALTTKRSYAEVLDMDRAIDLMKKSVGRKIDPELFQKLLPQITTMQSGKALPHDNLVLHPFFDPSVPYNKIELIHMPVHGYDQGHSSNYYGRVILAEETHKEKNLKKVS